MRTGIWRAAWITGVIWAGLIPARAAGDDDALLGAIAPPARTAPSASPLDQGAILLHADTLTYDAEQDIVRAEGHVEATYGTETLKADSLTYDRKQDRIVAQGNVSITQDGGSVLFADYVELTDQMREGLIRSFGALLQDNVRLAAASGRRKDGRINELTRSVFSACDVCDENGNPKVPLWRIKAFRAIQDEEKHTITYRDVFFEFYGVPVFYTPYFSHPDPTVKRKSGFLTPRVGNNSLLGSFAETPYYFALSPYYDLTVAPLITTDSGVVLKAEWRHNIRRGRYWLSGSFTNARARDANNQRLNERPLRGHVFGSGRFWLNTTWRTGFDLQIVNDDTYLRRYKISNNVDLESRAFLRGVSGRNYVDISSYYFQGLLQSDDSGLTPFILPLINAHYVYEPGRFGRINFDANAMVLQRTQGTDSRRVSLSVDWQRRFNNRLGQVFTPFASMRTDVYNVSDFIPGSPPIITTSSSSETIYRALPTVGVNVSWPFARSGNNVSFLLEPSVQAIYSPPGSNPDRIPNEDSQSFELDTSNLFAPDKFPGLDRVESGSRLNVGIRFGVYAGDKTSASFLFGRSFRTREADVFDPSTGLAGKKSDFVGTSDIQIGKHFSLIHKFRLDSDTLTPKRNELGAAFKFKRFSTRALYTSTKNINRRVGVRERKELNLKTKVRFTKNWSFGFHMQRDLIAKDTRRARISLTYEDECTIFSLSFQRRDISDRDIRPNDTVLFQFILKNLN